MQENCFLNINIKFLSEFLGVPIIYIQTNLCCNYKVCYYQPIHGYCIQQIKALIHEFGSIIIVSSIPGLVSIDLNSLETGLAIHEWQQKQIQKKKGGGEALSRIKTIYILYIKQKVQFDFLQVSVKPDNLQRA